MKKTPAMREQTSIAVVEQPFDAGAFWEKLRRFAKRAGRVVVERALRLYYASLDPATPAWARRAIYAGLAYFIVPFDLIPDFIPGRLTLTTPRRCSSRSSSSVRTCNRHQDPRPPEDGRLFGEASDGSRPPRRHGRTYASVEQRITRLRGSRHRRRHVGRGVVCAACTRRARSASTPRCRRPSAKALPARRARAATCDTAA
jgi:hypothetical protein